MAILLGDVLDRLAAIEVLALASLSTPVTADAKPFAIWQQEAFPYFTNRPGTITVENDSHDLDVYEVEIIVRLIVGHITEGVRGEPENKLYDYLPAVMEAINARELLQSPTYTTALLGLVSARAVSSGGMSVFETAGVQARQVGAQITVVCTFEDDLTQVYL